MQSEIGYLIAFAFHRNASSYVNTQQYKLAKKSYQKALEAYQSLSQVQERQKQLWIAPVYFQLGTVAYRYRKYEEARSYYQQALDICIEYEDLYDQAKIYHQLGMVAQELREYQQARSYYQQALDINIEYGDRYSQAITYAALGLLAEQTEDIEEAKTNLLQALQIYVEFNDEYGATFPLNNLDRIYKATQDKSILTEVASILGITVEQVRERLNQLEEEE